jgi:hypothetical protein
MCIWEARDRSRACTKRRRGEGNAREGSVRASACWRKTQWRASRRHPSRRAPPRPRARRRSARTAARGCTQRRAAPCKCGYARVRGAVVRLLPAVGRCLHARKRADACGAFSLVWCSPVLAGLRMPAHMRRITRTCMHARAHARTRRTRAHAAHARCSFGGERQHDREPNCRLRGDIAARGRDSGHARYLHA